jgi:RNA polymerase nonessential primary-like sigma factor
MNQSRTIRLPVHIIKELNIYLRARAISRNPWRRRSQRRGYRHLTGHSVDDVRRIAQLNERVASLDAPLDVDPTLSLGEAIADDNAHLPDEMLQLDEIEHHVHDWLTQLNAKQRWVIERRFGLNGLRGLHAGRSGAGTARSPASAYGRSRWNPCACCDNCCAAAG